MRLSADPEDPAHDLALDESPQLGWIQPSSLGYAVDLVTADFSGLDPDITEAGALVQVDRVAEARGLDPTRLRALVESQVQGRILWVFGEPHVNVLSLNMALDAGGAG